MGSDLNHHLPVLLEEIKQAFLPLSEREILRSFDGTFGRGGHYRSLKSMSPQLKTLAVDQDQAALSFAKENFALELASGDLELLHRNFGHFSEFALGEFDFILLDLGVSSPQLDQADRGFSFYQEGPLDMRMDQTKGLNAEYLVNTLSEEDLNKLFREFGEIYSPYRVVRAVVHDRKTKAFQSTLQLAQLIERVDGWKVKGRHPATQYFMALRLAVNGELEVLKQALLPMMNRLTMGGRLAVISFHSLEDRIVKNLFKEHSELGYPVHKKVLVAKEDECEANPRSRSAKLRIFQRGAQNERKKYPKY